MAAEAPLAGRPSLRDLARRFGEFVWDNPSAEHDARTILSSPKVGLWLGVEVLLLIGSCLLSFFGLPDFDSSFRRLVVSVGVAPYLVSSCLLTLTAFLTLMVPLRASGLLEGPRWRGYMDQLVTTGMSPLRYYAGKWATSQPFFWALIAASFPFVVLFGLLGEISWSRTFLSYLLIYGYCNVLLIVALGLGAVLHEVLALLLTWLLFSAATVLDYAPVPASLAALTPTRFLIEPFVEFLAGSDAALVGPLYATANPLGVALPAPAWTFIVWLILSAVVLLTCVLGPLHAYVPGMNNFGAVVLPGDGKRIFFRRLRPFLSRRVELAFLFENRGPHLVRWTLPLRSLQQVTLLGLLAVMVFSSLFEPAVLREVRRQDLVVFHGMVVGALLLVGLFVFSSGRVDGLQRFRAGRLAVPQMAFDAAAFVCFLAGIVVLHVIGFSSGWADLSVPRASWWRPLSPEECFVSASTNLAVLLTVAASAFLFVKAVGVKLLGRGWVYLLGLGYLAVLFVVPVFALAACDALRNATTPGLDRLATPAFALSTASPAIQMAVEVEGVPRWVDGSSWLVRKGFWAWHLPWTLLLGLMAFAGHRSLSREAAALSDDRPDDPESPACVRCKSRRRVPEGWTWWGGVLATRLTRAARCVDCGAEHSPRTGAPDHRTAFLILALRFGLSFIAAWLVLFALVQVLV